MNRKKALLLGLFEWLLDSVTSKPRCILEKKKWFMISDIERKSIKGRLKEKIRHRIQKNQHTYTVWMVRTQYNCS